MTFKESQFASVFNNFIKSICDQFIDYGFSINIKKSIFKLQLNDFIINNLNDINSSNGRYYFSDNWNSYIPHASDPGVYIFFNKNRIGLYVGKTEVNGGLGVRISKHIGPCFNNSFPYLEFPQSKYIIVIPFKKAPFLSSSFESFLLLNYKFEYNTIFQ